MGTDRQGGRAQTPLHLGGSPDELTAVAVIPLVPAWRVDRTFDYLVPEGLRGRVRVGSLVRVPFGHRKVRGVVVGSSEASGGELEPVAGVVLEHPVAAPPLTSLFEWLAARYVTPRGRVYDRAVPPRVRVKPRPIGARPPHTDPQLERLGAYRGGAELADAIAQGDAGVWSLEALPGDDRGALIAELVAAAARAESGAALVAVPEVRYGSKVLDAVGALFPDIARVDTSRSDLERARGWMELAAGAPVGAGGRAAVLAPSPRLRLIVLDEEHVRSYKEDRSPRYDARRVAVERARLQAAACVFVSSTPSLETSAGCIHGRFGRVFAPRSATRAARPTVQVAPPAEVGIGPELHAAVRAALGAGERVALLAATPGYARAVWCARCRRSVRCGVCEAGLVFERSSASTQCPRCGRRDRAPDTCPSCGASDFRLLGAGSERLSEQLARIFPRARVVRVDPEVLATADEAPSDLLEADIYLTTWIGTKSAFRPPVRTVGVLDADGWIRRPDFRASENAYHALAEMSAWAGPAGDGGRLVVQTEEPGHHAIQAVVRGDHSFFVERELEYRRELSYPPYTELVKVRLAGPAAHDLLQRIRIEAAEEGARVLGPVPVRPTGSAESADEILLKCPDAARVAVRLRGILPEVPRGSSVFVDVDPR